MSEGSEGGGGSERAPGRGRGGGRTRDYAALDEKVQRRLAQNREAARKSRQRKKDYMKQLEVEVGGVQSLQPAVQPPELTLLKPARRALQRL